MFLTNNIDFTLVKSTDCSDNILHTFLYLLNDNFQLLKLRFVEEHEDVGFGRKRSTATLS